MIRRATKEKPIIEVFRDFKSEIDFKEKPARASGPRAALEVRSMSELFRPPVELLFPGNYDQARQYAEANGRLMLVNVQVIRTLNQCVELLIFLHESTLISLCSAEGRQFRLPTDE